MRPIEPRHLTLALFAVLSFFPLAEARSKLPPTFSFFSEFVVGGQNYTALVIDPTDEPGETPYSFIPEGETEFANYIQDRAENWYISRIREFYPDIPGSFLANLTEENRKARNRSGLIVIMKDRDLERIQLTLRYVWTTEEDPLRPSETQFNIRFPQPAWKFGPYPQMKFPWNRQSPLVTTSAVLGDFDEMKMYAQAEDADFDFFPLAFVLGEISGASNRFQFRIPHINAFFDQAEANPQQIDEALRRLFPGFVTFSGGHFITSHKRLEPLYRSLGFTQIKIPGLPEPNIAMQMTRDEFFSRFRIRMESRRGFELVKSAKWTDLVSELGPDLDSMIHTAQTFGLDLLHLKCAQGLRKPVRPKIWSHLPAGVSIRARATQGHLIPALH